MEIQRLKNVLQKKQYFDKKISQLRQEYVKLSTGLLRIGVNMKNYLQTIAGICV